MGNNKYKLLVIEDESNILSFVRTILEANNYQVIVAKNCAEGKLMYSSHIPDLVILDLGLPDMDGLEFITYAREFSTVPIIVLSARTQESDKVSALDLGANDYITKPFGTEELLARVRATLRNNRYSAESGALAGGKYVLHDLVIDYDKRMVMIANNNVKLTQTEYNIVAYLSAHAGKVLTYASIIRTIWGSSDSGSIKKLQVNMANIRKKLGSKPGENKYIINELGVGYRMCDENE
ncbi:MAG: response regulator transcription factor [Ruminococcus sp.]|nr:response regulator transcription factor [Ruminococcus sp.]